MDFYKTSRGLVLLAVILVALWMALSPTAKEVANYTSTLPSISPVQVDSLEETPTCKTCQEEEPSQ